MILTFVFFTDLEGGKPRASGDDPLRLGLNVGGLG